MPELLDTNQTTHLDLLVTRQPLLTAVWVATSNLVREGVLKGLEFPNLESLTALGYNNQTHDKLTLPVPEFHVFHVRPRSLHALPTHALAVD
jgi:hypothetical protein